MRVPPIYQIETEAMFPPQAEDVTDVEYRELKLAVLKYLSEFDNPVPDYGYRRALRNYLRVLTGAPEAPPPQGRKFR
jgi:hypothetical protein